MNAATASPSIVVTQTSQPARFCFERTGVTGTLIANTDPKPKPLRRNFVVVGERSPVILAEVRGIARRANSSKTTFYSRFPTKEQLFLAVIERRMTGIFQQVAGSLPEERPIEETLRNFGSALIRLAMSKEQIALVRVVSMESAKFPELGKRFYELGPKRGEGALAAYLMKQVEKGRLLNEDTRQMAQHFISLVTGGPIRWFVFGFDRSSLPKSALQKHLNSAIQAFMRAYGRVPTN